MSNWTGCSVEYLAQLKSHDCNLVALIQTNCGKFEMSKSHLTPLTAMQVELALIGRCDCNASIEGKIAKAKDMGLTGAEIEAARSRRSFDAKTSVAIKYACAVETENHSQISIQEILMKNAGFDKQQCQQVTEIVSKVRDTEKVT